MKRTPTGICLFFLFIVIGFFTACGEKEATTSQRTNTYFNIKSFFEAEVQRLSGRSTPVHKAIARNGGAKESKSITIKDWNKELSLFIESDINKPAWVSSYEVSNQGDNIIYTSLDPELRTKKIIIKKNKEVVESISIHNEVSNQLYTSQEELYYSPDSIYRIEKQQDVRVIGSNHYLITGTFP